MTTEPTPQRPARAPRRWLYVVGGVAIALVAALVIVLVTDDSSDSTPAAEDTTTTTATPLHHRACRDDDRGPGHTHDGAAATPRERSPALRHLPLRRVAERRPDRCRQGREPGRGAAALCGALPGRVDVRHVRPGDGFGVLHLEHGWHAADDDRAQPHRRPPHPGARSRAGGRLRRHGEGASTRRPSTSIRTNAAVRSCHQSACRIMACPPPLTPS